MKQSGRGWILLLRDILESFNLTRLKTDESIWILRLPNLPDPLTSERPHQDCPSSEVILILISYVDDLLVLSNCPSLVTSLEQHCNKRAKIALLIKRVPCRLEMKIKIQTGLRLVS